MNDADEENVMTFDDRGKFISVKELKTKNIPHEETHLPNENKKEGDSDELPKGAMKESTSEKSDINETEIKQQAQEKSNEPIESLKTPQPVEVPIDSIQSVENLMIPNAEVLQQKLVNQQQQQLQTKLQMEESLSQKLNKISLNEV